MNFSGSTTQQAPLPQAPSAQRQHLRVRLLAKHEVAPRHFQFELHCPEVARGAQPGQFVHILAAKEAFEAGYDPLLRRAFSIMQTQGDNFRVLFRALGRGTSLLAQRAVGENLDLLGPLGRGFNLQAFHVKQKSPAVLVGGGVGVPPMVFLGAKLHSLGHVPTMILGARSACDVVCEADFHEQNTPLLLCTEDGSRGRSGRVTDELEPILSAAQSLKSDEKPLVFACGPWPMLRAVATLCHFYGVSVQVSLEENMPCGIGVCNGCVVPFKRAADDYEKYRRMCVDGPVCSGEEIEWN